MKPKSIIIVGFVAAVAVILFFSLRSKDRRPAAGDGKAPPVVATGDAGAAGAPPTAPTVEITVEYGTEKREWLEAAITDFRKLHPEIAIKLVGKGSLESAQAIFDGVDRPTVWSPADSLVLNLLASDWEAKHHAPLFATDGDDAPQPLLLSPLVFAVWEDRAEVLQKAAGGGALTWKVIHQAVSSPQGWPSVGGKAEWGFIKLGHTDPNKSNSGLQALLLMTLEYYGKTSGLKVGELLDPRYQKFIAEIERGVPRFEASTGTFMTDMVRFGPSKYDIAVVYESLAISQLENAQGRWGNLRVYYPQTTLWSDHPMALLQAEWVTPDQRAAARLLITHLRSRPVQATALGYGFRPADPSVPLKTAETANPFTRLAQYGVRLDVPSVAQVPDGPVVRNLLMMWSRVVDKK